MFQMSPGIAACNEPASSGGDEGGAAGSGEDMAALDGIAAEGTADPDTCTGEGEASNSSSSSGYEEAPSLQENAGHQVQNTASSAAGCGGPAGSVVNVDKVHAGDGSQVGGSEQVVRELVSRCVQQVISSQGAHGQPL